MSEDIRITTAGAGSGKTTALTGIISDVIARNECRPHAIIATTFTRAAVAELGERVRRALYEAGQIDAAQRLDESLLGTVHSVCARLLGRFAFEAGISPRIEVLDERVAQALMSEAIEDACGIEEVREMEVLAERLGQRDLETGRSKWKAQVRAVTYRARENAIAPEQLPIMAQSSANDLLAFFPNATAAPLDQQLSAALEAAIERIAGNGDSTAATKGVLACFDEARVELIQHRLTWSQWWKIAKVKPGKASLQAIQPVIETAIRVEEHPVLQAELRGYTIRLFGIAQRALANYQERKQQRGFLDFADLEARTLDLLRRPDVAEFIANEIDLLLVDEFQDTSPLQLALFLRLADQVRVRTVWVGDVKQAVYGFRGSDPELMNAAVTLVRDRGGATAPLDRTYRARPELAGLFNDIFVPAFGATHNLQPTEIALHPHRPEQIGLPRPLEYWTISTGRNNQNGTPKPPTNANAASALCDGVARLLADEYMVEDRRTHSLRPLRAGDIAILSDKHPRQRSRYSINRAGHGGNQGNVRADCHPGGPACNCMPALRY